MSFVETAKAKFRVIGELWAFMREYKKYWLMPIFIVLISFGLLIALAQGTPVAPFIYAIF